VYNEAVSDKAPATWTEVTARVAVGHRDALVAWFLNRGASGVQEEYPSLGTLGEDGPVVSGCLGEWDDEEPDNPGTDVVIRAWIPGPGVLNVGKVALQRTFPGVEVETREVGDRNWNRKWLEDWQTTSVGQRFLVCPAGKVPRDTGSRLLLHLTPGMAFGTGTHFTTVGCLEILEEIAGDGPLPGRVLDVGTGSGILAIGALLLRSSEALGLDLEDDILNEARANAELNGVGERFVTSAQALTAGTGRFDLVFANLIAQVILALADILTHVTARGGHLVLSGILLCHEDEIIQTFESRGLTLSKKKRNDDWVAMAFAKPTL